MRRGGYRVLRALCAAVWFVIGPFVVKHDDGTFTLGWVAIGAGALLYVLILRLLPLHNADGSSIFAAVGWPEVWLAILSLYVKPINDSLNAYAKKNPEGLVNALLSRLGVGEVALQDAGMHGPANLGAPGGDVVE